MGANFRETYKIVTVQILEDLCPKFVGSSKDNDNVLYCFGRFFYFPNEQLAPRVLSQCRGLGESTTPCGINKSNTHTHVHMNKYICKLLK